MWCSTCQQDIPALGSPSRGGELRCGKCGGYFAAAEPANAQRAETAGSVHAAAATPAENVALEKLLHCPPLPEDDWTLEAELRGVQRLLNSLKSRPATTESVSLHLPEMDMPDWHAQAMESTATNDSFEPGSAAAGQPRPNPAAWMILSLSLAVFACGAVLLGWSLLGQRDDLWSIGLPLALIGQAGLVLGLVLQIEGLSGHRAQENRLPLQHARRGTAHAKGRIQLPQ